MASFAKLATVTASTKRQGAITDGLSGDMAENIASLKCLPLDPLNADVAARAGLGDYHELLRTMVEGGLDILEGDVLVVSGTEYAIKSVEEWYWRPSANDTLLLVLKEAK